MEALMASYRLLMPYITSLRTEVYNFYFYLLSYVMVGILGLLATFFIVLIMLATMPKKVKSLTLLDFNSQIKALKDSDSAQKIYNFFISHFLSAPSDLGHFKDWLDCISSLATSSFLRLEAITELRQKLEKANPMHQDEIKSIVTTAMKNRPAE